MVGLTVDGIIYYSSLIGLMEIQGDDKHIHSIRFVEEGQQPFRLLPLLEQCVQELDEYFGGTRRKFTVPFFAAGTEFQQQVWQELCRIPYGETASYGDIAAGIGNPKAVRAVGGANNKNPLPIIIPCHRVIGADGSMTGYGGGVWRKERLLALEQACRERCR